MNRNNPVKKNMEKFQRPATHVDKKREAKKRGTLSYTYTDSYAVYKSVDY